MRIAWVTKWGLPGWHKCRATGALGEAGKSSLVSGGAEMWRNSISYHPALYIANCLFGEARKKNFQLFRALKPQPTSWVGWGTWLGSVQTGREVVGEGRDGDVRQVWVATRWDHLLVTIFYHVFFTGITGVLVQSMTWLRGRRMRRRDVSLLKICDFPFSNL